MDSKFIEKKLITNKIKPVCVPFLIKMLLCDKLRLSDIPPALRVLDIAVYTSALRVSRNISRQRYQEDLKIMKADFSQLPPFEKQHWNHYYRDSVEDIKYCLH